MSVVDHTQHSTSHLGASIMIITTKKCNINKLCSICFCSVCFFFIGTSFLLALCFYVQNYLDKNAGLQQWISAKYGVFFSRVLSISFYVKYVKNCGVFIKYKQNNCKRRTLFGNKQWRAVGIIKHCEKQLSI